MLQLSNTYIQSIMFIYNIQNIIFIKNQINIIENTLKNIFIINNSFIKKMVINN